MLKRNVDTPSSQYPLPVPSLSVVINYERTVLISTMSQIQSTALTTCIIPVYNQIRKKPTTLIIPPNQQPSNKAIRKTCYSLSSNRHCVIVCYHDIFLQIIGMIFFIAASSRTEAVRVKGGENKGIIFQLES